MLLVDNVILDSLTELLQCHMYKHLEPSHFHNVFDRQINLAAHLSTPQIDVI